MQPTDPPELGWTDRGTPVSRRFADPYFSDEDGLAETRHVFLRGNGLPERFRPDFAIAELGFGTGLNFLAAWAAWQEAGQPGPLRFTSFELAPLEGAPMARALARWPELAPLASAMLSRWSGPGAYDLGTARLRVIAGDARDTLPRWEGRADAWFLDGFAPARNPQMWEPGLIAALAARTAPGGTAATYSAAGHVRRALAATGFDVEKRPGHGRKREMVAARLLDDPSVA